MADFEPMPPAEAQPQPQPSAPEQPQEEKEESDIVFETPGAKPKTLLWILISVGTLIILGGGGWGVYTLLNKPAAEGVTVTTGGESTSPEISVTIPSPTLTPAEQRDKTRKADLAEIKNALDAYFIDTGAYPQTSGMEKTNATVSNLKTALVSAYIASLPVDPQDPTFYYGYKSDGITYELTSVLEDQNDPAGEVSGSYFIQKITP
ncbi:type II secretion system protein GspG [Candidatus Berkelbacteria bacterium]|nr:type II secretion system protein GspG [Candidatus Berkelbacteria bacterium]